LGFLAGAAYVVVVEVVALAILRPIVVALGGGGYLIVVVVVVVEPSGGKSSSVTGGGAGGGTNGAPVRIVLWGALDFFVGARGGEMATLPLLLVAFIPGLIMVGAVVVLVAITGGARRKGLASSWR